MFSLFKKGPKAPAHKDIIWIDKKVKQLHFLTFINRVIAQNPVYILSSFEDNLNDIESKLNVLQLNYKRLNDWSDYENNISIYVLHTTLLNRDTGGISISSGMILFLEHFPTFEEDVTFMEQAIAKLNSNEIKFYLSLEDPLFQSFGGERIQNMMRQLGMDDNEPIEHSMITKSIANAQKKLSKKQINHASRKSETEWYKRNIST